MNSARTLECGDWSPLSPLADLSASEGAFSARYAASRMHYATSNGDKSPDQSGDKSPHSKTLRDGRRP